MPRNFKLPAQLNFGRITVFGRINVKDPRVAVRAALAVLLAANVAAALWAFKPWGGSAEDLARERDRLQKQVSDLQLRLVRSKTLVDKVDKARKEGDRFLDQYLSERRITFSLLVAELNRAAKDAGIKPREASYVLEPVEGSDTLGQMTITAAYEGSYANLTKFVNLLDKSPRFLILESMQATPQQSGATLTVSFKLDTFVRESAGGQS